MTLTQLLKAKLKASYAAFANETGRMKRREVRLPGPSAPDGAHPDRALISFDGVENAVTLRLNAAATKANMQTDAAAFEAWALILKVWCEVDEVSLRWEAPEDRHDPHYQRFLYRANQFRKLFDWFHVDNDNLLRDARFLPGDHHRLLLNLPTKPRRTREQYQRDMPGWEPKGERQLEITLRDSSEFAAIYGLEPGRVERQIPVGLFRDCVSAGNRVFSGSGSAIDLVGVQGETLWLFELKAGDNAAVGAISELFFYACLLRDSGPKGPFEFSKSRVAHSRVTVDIFNRCSQVEAVVLGEKIHPLLEHSEITGLLNRAANNLWGGAHGGRTVHFSVDRIEVQKDGVSLTRTPVA